MPWIKDHLVRDQRIKEQYLALSRIEDIAKREKVTRQCVHKALKRQGIDTALRQSTTSTCPVCGAEVRVRRAKRTSAVNHYCNQECYLSHLIALGEDYKPSRYHSRIARKIVMELFPGFTEGHVVHHVDKNNKNNALQNLWVFKNQSDHIKYHRGFVTLPIWVGSEHLL